MRTYHTLEVVRAILDGNAMHEARGFRLVPEDPNNTRMFSVLLTEGCKEHPSKSVIQVDINEFVERTPFEATIILK